MASLFWVGGTSSYDGVTNRFATSSGGVATVAAITSADDVFFDAASGAVTATMGAGFTCNSLTCTGFTGTFDLNAKTVQIGISTASTTSLTLVSGMTLLATGGGTFSFALANGGTCTITTGGKTMPSVSTSGSSGGGTFTLADNYSGGLITHNVGTLTCNGTFTLTGQLTLTAGTLNTNGQTCTWGSFNSDNSNTRTITLGSSQIACTLAGAAWVVNTLAGLTVTANTATLTLTGATVVMRTQSINWNGLTVIFDGAASGSGAFGIDNTSGATPTFANLIVLGNSNKGCNFVCLVHPTITGLFRLVGNSITNRIFISSSTAAAIAPGIQRTITAANVGIANADFMDITGAGTASWNLTTISGGSGDCQGNSGITFTTPATQTWQNTSGGFWSNAANWSGRIPLPQDDVNISSAFVANSRIVWDMPRLGKSISFAGTTGSPTLSYANTVGAAMRLFGSLNTTGIGTITASGIAVLPTICGRSSFTLTTGGVSFPSGAGVDVSFQSPGGTYTLQDNLNWGCNPSINWGTFDANNFNVTVYGFAANPGVNAGTVRMGTGIWTLTGAPGNIWNVNSNCRLDASQATIVMNNSTSNARSFIGNGQNFNNVYQVSSGTGVLTIIGNNTFKNLDLEAYSPRTVILPAGGTQRITNRLTLLGANTPSGLILQSSTPGTATTLTLVSGTPAVNPFVALTSDVNLNARWWVGGNGSWDAITTTHWSVIPASGGGASAPGGSTHAYFDGNSGLDFINNAVSLASSARAGGWTISGTATPSRFVVNNPILTSGTYNFIGGLTTPIKFESSNFGSQASFTFNGATYGVIQNVMASDLAIGGNSGTLSGTRMGDCAGNSNIFFEPSSPQTWQGGNGNWSDPTKWTSRVPLPQDDVFIAATNANINVDMRFTGRTIDFTGSTGTTASAQLSSDGVGNTENYGSFVLVQGGNWQNSNGTHSFNGRGTHTITTAGNTVNSTMQIRTFGTGSYTLVDSINISTGRSFTVNAGTFNSNDQSILCRGFGVTNAVTTVINLGRSTITCAGTTGVTIAGSLAVTTYNMTNSTFLLTDATTAAKTFAGGGASYGTVRQVVGSGTLNITGSNTFNVLDIESSGGLSRTINLPAGGTQTINRALAVYAASGTNLNVASSVPGSATTITMISGSNPLFMNQTFSSDVVINYPKIRYWVGGAGSWDNVTTTNWALTSSGVGGASAPDANTTVVFDYNSGLNTTQSVTIAANALCLGLGISAIGVHPFPLGKATKFLFSGTRTLGGSVTSSGSFSFLGRDQATPLQITSSTAGNGRQVFLNGVHGLHKWANFQDLMVLGTAGTLSGTLLGDMLGNSGNIVFEQSVPQSWVLGSTGGNYSNPNNWTSRVPLPQDDVTIAGNLTGQTINLDVMTMGRNLDMSNATGNPTLNRGFNTQCWIFGNINTPNSVVWGGNNQQTMVLAGRGSQTWNPGNSGWGFTFQMTAPSGTYTLQRSINVSQVSGGFNVAAGTLDTGGWAFGCKGDLSIQAAAGQLPAILVARGSSITLGGNSINNGLQVNNSSGNFVSGSGTWTIAGNGTAFTVLANAAPNMNLTEATIIFTDTTSTLKTFAGAGATYGTVRKLGNDTGGFTITGNNNFKNLEIDNPSGATVTFPALGTQTVSGTLTLSGTVGTSLPLVSSITGRVSQINVLDPGSHNLQFYTATSDIVFNFQGPSYWGIKS